MNRVVTLHVCERCRERILVKVLERWFCHLCDRPQTYEEQLCLMEQRVMGRS
jgi:hypothetical protein